MKIIPGKWPDFLYLNKLYYKFCKTIIHCFPCDKVSRHSLAGFFLPEITYHWLFLIISIVKKDKIRCFLWVIRKFHWNGLTRGVLLHCGKKLGRHRGLEPRTLQQSWLSSALPDELMAVYLICPVLASGHISFGVGAYYGEVKIQSWWNHDNFDWFIILVQPGKPVFHRIFNSDKIRENHSVSKVTVYVFFIFFSHFWIAHHWWAFFYYFI